jgi:hypothetical protein
MLALEQQSDDRLAEAFRMPDAARMRIALAEAARADADAFAAGTCTTLGNGTEHFVDTSCQAFRPITYSSRDTEQTKTEVRARNRVYDRLCPGDGA